LRQRKQKRNGSPNWPTPNTQQEWSFHHPSQKPIMNQMDKSNLGAMAIINKHALIRDQT